MRRGRRNTNARIELTQRLHVAWDVWAGKQRRSQADLARTIRQHLGCAAATAYRHARALLIASLARWEQLPVTLRASILKARAIRDLLHLEEVRRVAA